MSSLNSYDKLVLPVRVSFRDPLCLMKPSIRNMVNYYFNYIPIVMGFVCILVYPVFSAAFFERNGQAIDGCDPVSYFTEMKPVKEVPEFRDEFQGSTFNFVSAAHRDAFVADPDKFSPQYGGYCAYGMAKGYNAKIDPAAFSVVHDKLYLNYNEAIRSRWLTGIPSYIKQADANWPEVQKQSKVHE